MPYRETEEWRAEISGLQARLDKLEKVKSTSTHAETIYAKAIALFVSKHKGLIATALLIAGGCITGRMNELWFAVPMLVIGGFCLLGITIVYEERRE